MSTLGAPSRFAVLKTDVVDPFERKKRSNTVQAVLKKPNNDSQKKNKAKQTSKTKKKETKQNGSVEVNRPTEDEERFNEWKKKDEQLTEDLFQQDLQHALLQSRIEQSKAKVSPVAKVESTDMKRKGKITLSLGEFNEKFPAPEVPCLPAKADFITKALAQAKLEEEAEERIRSASQFQAASIVAREKAQRELSEQKESTTVSRVEYDHMLEMKKKQIEHMAKVLNNTKKELTVSQEQNADLENVLKKGEMKKKVELLKEVEELRTVRDELSTQLQAMSVELERERSKSNRLEHELLRFRSV